jgi:hypothetical protein
MSSIPIRTRHLTRAVRRHLAVATVLCLAAGASRAGGPITSIVNAANTIQATAVAICLAIMTTAWAVAGYRMAYQGVAFRDVSSTVIGGAVAGTAGAIAAVFMG